MTKCSQCHQEEATIRAMIGGTYYPDLGPDCKAKLSAGQGISSGHARWARTIDAEDNEAAIQQPRNKDGTINGRFCRLYPRQAAALFTPEQMRKAT